MKNRWGLIQRGLFPETLPPCFTSQDLKRAFSGLVNSLKEKSLHQKRHCDYIVYSGTKHDGSRRYFGTPNPIPYFHVCDFIAANWETFRERFENSPLSVSQPRVGKDTDDRPIIIPSLSQLTTIASKKLGHSAYILKTDIAQFFPSIYTHSIPWSAHGIAHSKLHQEIKSELAPFNKLDFFVRNCQRGETRGVLVGPDAFRLVAEFIAAGLDADTFNQIKSYTVGAARHVDDYYIGLSTQPEALAALSVLRDVLQSFNLQINDAKTKTMLGIEPLNDIWAQDLREQSRRLRDWGTTDEQIVLFLGKSLQMATDVKSDSPVKIALRTLDQIKIYQKSSWDTIEPYLQRIMFHHPHCIDYVALLLAKRIALTREIDGDGWRNACHDLLRRHLSLNHHHETTWLFWILICMRVEIAEQLVIELSRSDNSHVIAMVIAAFKAERITKRPPVKLGGRLASTEKDWLTNLVARSAGFTNASFSGQLAPEFEHLALKKVKLIDYTAHINAVKPAKVRAISRTRYGYDNDDDDYDMYVNPFEDLDEDPGF